jgi:2-polyprenyl-6-methoxyphenol hydroxylase-like FAD-dependent oxidoreductase
MHTGRAAWAHYSAKVGIVGAGPAGLMLSHLLARQGIGSVVVDNRTRLWIENTVRAGILEQASVQLLVETGLCDNVLTEGEQHRGIALALGGRRTSTCSRTTWSRRRPARRSCDAAAAA